jgi:Flp pilus assembly protein TadD
MDTLIKSALTIAGAKHWSCFEEGSPVRLLFILLSFLLASALHAQTAPPAPQDLVKPEQLQQFLRVAQRLSAQGDLRGAIGFYNQVLAASPNNEDALAGLADVLVAAGQPLEATPYYQKLESLKPADMRYAMGYARALNRAQRPGQALPIIEKAIAANAQGGMAWTEKGLALDLLGRFKEAQQAYGQALKLSPNNPETLQRMAFSFACIEEYRTALNLIGDIANLPGGKEQVRNPLATIYAMSGQSDQAMKIAAMGAPEGEDVSNRKPYYDALPKLDQLSKARAVHLGVMAPDMLMQQTSSKSPPSNETIEDSGKAYNAPADPKPAKPGKPQMVAMPQEAADTAETASDSATAAVAPAAASPMMRATSMGAGDRIWVQLGLSPSRATLEKQWNTLVARASGGLNGLAPYVQPIVADGKSQLRLLVGGYADGSTATALGKRLRAMKIVNFINRNALPADPLYP